MFYKPQRLHFTGIGGIGMSGIAEILLNLGYTISGSDVKLTPVTDRLQALGATVHEGHSAAHVAGAGCCSSRSPFSFSRRSPERCGSAIRAEASGTR